MELFLDMLCTAKTSMGLFMQAKLAYTHAQTRMHSGPLLCACYPHVYELQQSCAGRTAINDELFNTTL